MKEINIEELKRLQLSILYNVDSFCREKDIKYTLFFGSLLGAIRHNGYIPWDDDIDIAMTRENYDRFLNSFNGSFDNLYVYAPELDYDYYAPYANVCDIRTVLEEETMGHNNQQIGVKIDVFPLDGVMTKSEYLKRRRIISICNSILGCKRKNLLFLWNESKSRFVKCLIIRILTVIVPYRFFQRILHNTAIKNSNKTAPFLAEIVFMGKKPRVYKSSWFDNYKDVVFENTVVRTIEEYDSYLRIVYDDYMKLPPEDKRVAKHGFRAYWKENV